MGCVGIYLLAGLDHKSQFGRNRKPFRKERRQRKLGDVVVLPTLLPSDPDKELYQKICEAAKEQNMLPRTFQRELLCRMLSVPQNHLAETQLLLIHKALTERCAAKKTEMKCVVRNYFRQYFGMPPLSQRNQNLKKRWSLRLKQGQKRFQVLGFLLTVDAATELEIEEALGMYVGNVLRLNNHYFECFRIPYLRQNWYRATKWGRQDYVAIAGEVETVRESKVESVQLELKKMREGAIQEMIALEQKMISGLN